MLQMEKDRSLVGYARHDISGLRAAELSFRLQAKLCLRCGLGYQANRWHRCEHCLRLMRERRTNRRYEEMFGKLLGDDLKLYKKKMPRRVYKRNAPSAAALTNPRIERMMELAALRAA